jgi:hypothetical protein
MLIWTCEIESERAIPPAAGSGVRRDHMNRTRRRGAVIAAIAAAAALVLIGAGAVWAYREYSYATSIVRDTAPGGTESLAQATA